MWTSLDQDVYWILKAYASHLVFWCILLDLTCVQLDLVCITLEFIRCVLKLIKYTVNLIGCLLQILCECFAVFYVTLFHWARSTIYHICCVLLLIFFSLHCSRFVTQHCRVLGRAAWCRWGTLWEMGHAPSDPVHARGL